MIATKHTETAVRHYPRNIGDWMAATAHLSSVEECMYSRLVDQYYAREEPLPLDLVACCRLARAVTGAERKAVAVVVPEFFDQQEDGWHQKRCDEEIDKFRERSASASESARSMWSKRNANAKRTHMRTHSEGNANQEPVTKNQEPKKFNDIVGLTPDDACQHIEEKEEKQLAGKDLRDAAKRVLECLNRNAGRKYEPVDANITPILARMREGYGERDLCAIAAVKARQWKGDERMEQYIRPKTLFNATNAANYRAELPLNKIDPQA